MNHSRARVLVVCILLIAITSSGFFYHRHLRYQAMHAMPNGLFSFKLSDPLPICARWKEHMPPNRDPATYRLYIEARKLWRSKIEWQLTHAEALRILTDVNLASQKGDWGARALMSYFYLHGLGPLDSNHVLDPDPAKAIELTRMAVAAGQPWGHYDMGVAYEHGYGGVPYDEDIAWAYYLRAAQLGSPEAQMALADAYSSARRFEDEEFMMRCAYEQGHGAAAYKLAIKQKILERYHEAIKLCQDGVKFGDENSASSLHLLFTYGYWFPTQKNKLLELGIKADLERSIRYSAIVDALEINPDLKLIRLDQTLPLPPAELPDWKGVGDALESDSTALPAY